MLRMMAIVEIRVMLPPPRKCLRILYPHDSSDLARAAGGHGHRIDGGVLCHRPRPGGALVLDSVRRVALSRTRQSQARFRLHREWARAARGCDAETGQLPGPWSPADCGIESEAVFGDSIDRG